MIKTIRNYNNKVVGICINNKKFQLPREVCHALSIEEMKEQEKITKSNSYAEKIRNSIRDNQYFGESKGIKIQINFNDDKTIALEKGKIEFSKEMALLHPKEKALCLELVENLLKALNQATLAHNKDLQCLMTNISKKIAS